MDRRDIKWLLSQLHERSRNGKALNLTNNRKIKCDFSQTLLGV